MTATYHVWPGLDSHGTSLVVYAEDSVTLIPAVGGALVPYAKYYRDLQAIGRLLDYDPLGLSGDPITVPPITRASGSVIGDSIEAVIAAAGSYSGQTEVCSSRWSDGTGPGGELIWLPTEAAVDGVDVYANFPGSGSWRRRKFGQSPVVRSTTIRANGTSDDTLALENTLASLFKRDSGRQGSSLRLEPSDTLVISDTITLDPSIHESDCSIIGAKCRGTLSNGPRVLWRGAAGKPVFAVGTRGYLFDGLIVFPDTGYTATTLIDFQFLHAGAPIPPTALRIRNSHLGPVSGGQYVDYCLTTNLLGPGGSIQNLEDVFIDDVYFAAREACVRQYLGQPYRWVLRNCTFTSVNGPSACCGRGMWLQNSSASVALESPAFGPLSVAIAIDTDVTVSISGITDVEKVKCLIGRGDGSFAVGGGGNIGAPITIQGGRFAQDNYNSAATNPTIAAGQHWYIYNPLSNSLLTLDGCQFDGAGSYLSGWKIVSVGSVSARGCVFPNDDPFLVAPNGVRDPRLFAHACVGHRASADVHGAIQEELRYSTGTVSPSYGSVVVSDLATTAVLTWAEQYPPFLDLDVVVESGAPAAGALTWTRSTPTTTGSTVTLGAAPGVGNSVRVLWRISPRGT